MYTYNNQQPVDTLAARVQGYFEGITESAPHHITLYVGGLATNRLVVERQECGTVTISQPDNRPNGGAHVDLTASFRSAQVTPEGSLSNVDPENGGLPHVYHNYVAGYLLFLLNDAEREPMTGWQRLVRNYQASRALRQQPERDDQLGSPRVRDLPYVRWLEKSRTMEFLRRRAVDVGQSDAVRDIGSVAAVIFSDGSY